MAAVVPSFMRRIAAAVLVLATAGGCRAVLGLDEPLARGAAPDDAGETTRDSGRDDAGDTAPEPTCAADLARDPENCGRCGRSCAGGACKDGRCAAVPLTSPVITVAAGPAGAAWIVRGGGGESDRPLYGCEGRCTTAAAATRLRVVDTPEIGHQLHVGAEHVYFQATVSAQSGVFRCGLGGCAAPELVARAVRRFDVDEARGFVFYPVRYSASDCRGTFRDRIGTDAFPTQMDPRCEIDSARIVDTAFVFRSPEQRLERCPPTGCVGAGAPVVLAESVVALTMVGTRGYWFDASTSTVRTCDLPGCEVVASVATVPLPVLGMVADRERLYLNFGSALGACRLDTTACTPERLWTALGAESALDLSLGPDALFFVAGETLFRLATP